MSYGFPACTRLSLIDRPQRRVFEPCSEPLSSTPPRLPSAVPLDHPEGTSALPDSLWNSSFRIRNFSPSPCCAQSYRNILTFLSLELHGLDPFFCHVHETLQVRSLAIRQSKFLRASQLSAYSRRLSSLPHHLHLSSIPRSRLHARCSHVLRAFPNSSAVFELSQPSTTTLQPSRSPREQLHRPLPPPIRLHLHPPREHSPLCSRRTPRRKLRSTSISHSMVENQSNRFPSPQPVCQSPGILGPVPLDSHSTRSTPSSFQRKTDNLFPHSKMPRSARGDLSSSTTSPPSRPVGSLRRTVHIHSSSENPSNFRPRRVCPNSLEQAPVRMGFVSSLGQSPNVRPAELSRPSKCRFRLLPVAPQQTATVPFSASSPNCRENPSILGPHPSTVQSLDTRNSNSSSVRFPPSVLRGDRPARPLVFGSVSTTSPTTGRSDEHSVSSSIFPPSNPQSSRTLQPALPQTSCFPSAVPQITSSVALVENHSPSELFRTLSCSIPALHQSSLPSISTRWIQRSPSSFGLQSGVVVGNVFCPTTHPVPSTPPQSPRSSSRDSDDSSAFSSCPESPTGSLSSGYTTLSTLSPRHWISRSFCGSRPVSPSSPPIQSFNQRASNGLSFSFFR
nr:movement protein [Scrophularia mottle virus]